MHYSGCLRYFYISKGSLAELETQTLIGSEVGYFSCKELEDVEIRVNALSGKLRKLIKYRESLI